MNKILNPNYGITAATNIDMFKGEDMVEIVTDGYGKIYAYPEDIRKIAPFVNKVKNGMKSISLGKEKYGLPKTEEHAWTHFIR